jgi:uncharacterized protein (DUF4213/DUF364 family)
MTMKVLDDLTATLDFGAPVRDILQGCFWTAVVTRNCGLASTPHDVRFDHGTSPVKEAGSLMQKDPAGLARMAYSGSANEAAIGIATINSLLAIDESRCVELNAFDLIAEKGAGKKVAIVGHFPFVEKLRGVAEQLWVVERNQREGDVHEGEAETLVPQADVVAITGSTLVNHTFEQLVGLCDSRALVIVLGPSTPLSPVLFDHGVDVVSGTRVIDSEKALRYVSQGASFRQMRGVRLLTMRRASE